MGDEEGISSLPQEQTFACRKGVYTDERRKKNGKKSAAHDSNGGYFCMYV